MLLNNNKLNNIDMNLKFNQRYYRIYLLEYQLAQGEKTILDKLHQIFFLILFLLLHFLSYLLLFVILSLSISLLS